MLRLRCIRRIAIVIALCGIQPVLAQSIGLSSKLDEAEKKLDADIKACRPINTKEYDELLDEVYSNLNTALKALSAGVPVDADTLRADERRAKALVKRAEAAAANPCPPPAKNPQNAGPPKKKVEPPAPETSPQGVNGLGGGGIDPLSELSSEAFDALWDLAEAEFYCDADAVKKLIPELEDLAKRARDIANTAKAAGQFSRVDAKKADALATELENALADAKAFKGCILKVAPKAESRTSKPPENPKPEQPSKPPVTPENKKGVSYELNPFASSILEIHNEARAAVGAKPLQWDPKLADDALAYAGEIARMGQLVHAPREGRGIERENLNEAFHGSSPIQLMGNWLNERRDFAAGYFPNVARDGSWMNVAHYTQIIWPTTELVGCGEARGAQWDFFVCRYSPGGNKDGQPVGYRDPSMFLGGPLDFNPSWSPVLKAYRPSNPDRLEFGDDAIDNWNYIKSARGRCLVSRMSDAIDELKHDAQGAREHAAEERTKGNKLLSESYEAMAKQIDERVEDATLYRDACARNPYQYQERG